MIANKCSWLSLFNKQNELSALTIRRKPIEEASYRILRQYRPIRCGHFSPVWYIYLNQVGSILGAYANPLNPTNPQVNFKQFITPNAKFIAYCGFFQSISAICSILSMLFLVENPKICTCIINFILALLSLGCCWMVPLQIMLAVSSWNQINNVKQSFTDLFSSVFVGDISKIQSFLNAEIYACLLFFAFAIYNVYYWSTLFVKAKRQEYKERAKS